MISGIVTGGRVRVEMTSVTKDEKTEIRENKKDRKKTMKEKKNKNKYAHLKVDKSF